MLYMESLGKQIQAMRGIHLWNELYPCKPVKGVFTGLPNGFRLQVVAMWTPYDHKEILTEVQR